MKKGIKGMKGTTPEQAAGEWLQEFENRANSPERVRAGIKTAWKIYNDPETPDELREIVKTSLDTMIDSL